MSAGDPVLGARQLPVSGTQRLVVHKGRVAAGQAVCDGQGLFGCVETLAEILSRRFCRLPCGRGGAGSGAASTSPRFQERVWAQSCWAAVDPCGHDHAAPAWVAYCSCWLISARSPCGSSASTVIAHHPGASAGRLPFRVAQHRPPLDTHGCLSANSSSMRHSSPARSPRVPVTVPPRWERPGPSPGSGACHLRTGG